MEISRFPVPAVEELPGDLAERVRAIAEKTGFVPNVFLALAHRPDELRAFLAYHDAVMERDGGLSKAEREMVVVATSSRVHCTYCVVAHGAILRIRTKDPTIADYIACGYHQAPIAERQRAILDYAVKLSLTPHLVTDDDVASLRDARLDDEEIWDVAAVVALFALSNRMAHALALRPNEEFHLMGRLPRREQRDTGAS
jgi:uncharacterized peroxidase-related enzyme